MLLHVIARGKIARSPEGELAARYAKRIAWPLKLTELPETGGKVADPVTPMRTVLLDERGRDLASEEFAAILGRWRDEGVREARFVLGAADGHGDAARREARKDLLQALLRDGGGLGLLLEAPEPLRRLMRDDSSGDPLDATLCLLQAAWAASQPDWGQPADVDPLEGWIVGAT